MITLELENEEAVELLSILVREQKDYTTVEEHTPERVKQLRSVIVKIDSLLENYIDV